jgi:type I restriction enzyme S subunit
LSELSKGGLFSDGDWVESKDQDASGSVRLTQLADVGVGEFRNRSDRWMRPDQAEALRCTYLKPDDILIARMPDPLGRACLVPEGIGSAVTAVDVAILRIRRSDVDPRYVMWAINSPVFHARVVELQSGTTRKRISRRKLATLTIPVPPFGEQRRIVEILENHLSSLGAAAAGLTKSEARLRALRQAFLSRLAIGSAIRLGDLTLESRYGTSTKCVVAGSGQAVVRIPNLINGRIDLTEEKRAADPTVNLSGLQLRPGDVLIVRTNGSRELIGRSAVVQEGVEAAFASYLIRYRVDTARIRPSWLRLMLETPQLRHEIERMAASSAGQYNLGLKKLDRLQIPCPRPSTQDALLKSAEEFEWSITGLRRAVAATAQRGEGLSRSLLAAAFYGRLTGESSDRDRVQELANV